MNTMLVYIANFLPPISQIITSSNLNPLPLSRSDGQEPDGGTLTPATCPDTLGHFHPTSLMIVDDLNPYTNGVKKWTNCIIDYCY